eukprot:438468_1
MSSLQRTCQEKAGKTRGIFEFAKPKVSHLRFVVARLKFTADGKHITVYNDPRWRPGNILLGALPMDIRRALEASPSKKHDVYLVLDVYLDDPVHHFAFKTTRSDDSECIHVFILNSLKDQKHKKSPFALFKDYMKDEDKGLGSSEQELFDWLATIHYVNYYKHFQDFGINSLDDVASKIKDKSVLKKIGVGPLDEDHLWYYVQDQQKKQRKLKQEQEQKERLKEWLTTTVKLPAYYKNFVAHGLTLPKLADWGDDNIKTHLTQIGINLIGHQSKLKKDILELQLKDWLTTTVKLPAYYKNFVAHGLTLPKLADWGDDNIKTHLTQIGINLIGHQSKLKKEIKDLRAKKTKGGGHGTKGGDETPNARKSYLNELIEHYHHKELLDELVLRMLENKRNRKMRKIHRLRLKHAP